MTTCPKVNICWKIAIVMDKDFASDQQCAETIRAVCKRCEDGRTITNKRTAVREP